MDLLLPPRPQILIQKELEGVYVRVKIYETNKRSFAKALTYRIYQSFMVSPLILYLLTHNLVITLSFSLAEFLVKIPAYYLFERIWSLIKHGYK